MYLFEVLTPLFENFKLAQAEFAQDSGDATEVAQTIKDYRELLPKLKGAEKDINEWRKQGWDKFKEFVKFSKETSNITKSQVKKKNDTGKSITLFEKPPYLVVIPLDHDSSCYHGKNTSWCTTKPNQSHFGDYFYKSEVTLIYVLNTETGDKNAIEYTAKYNDTELFDIKNNSISAEQFKQNTTFDPVQLIELAKKKMPEIEAGREESRPNDIATLLAIAIRTKTRNPRLEKLLIAKNAAEASVDYAKNVINGEWEEAEPYIMKDPASAFKYVRTVLYSRWRAAENYIKKDDNMWAMYTSFVNSL